MFFDIYNILWSSFYWKWSNILPLAWNFGQHMCSTSLQLYVHLITNTTLVYTLSPTSYHWSKFSMVGISPTILKQLFFFNHLCDASLFFSLESLIDYCYNIVAFLCANNHFSSWLIFLQLLHDLCIGEELFDYLLLNMLQWLPRKERKREKGV